MSYDIRIKNKKTDETVVPNGICPIKSFGGTYKINKDGTPADITGFTFNITYNYYPILRQSIGNKNGIRYIYGMNIFDAMMVLNKAIVYIYKKYKSVMYKDVRGADPEKMSYNEILKCYTYDIPDKPPTITQMKKQNNIMDNYWAVTPQNVITSLLYITYCCQWIIHNFTEEEYKNFIFDGD